MHHIMSRQAIIPALIITIFSLIWASCDRVAHITDNQAPVITAPDTIFTSMGDSVDYARLVTAIDNGTDSITPVVNDSAANLDKPGNYPVTISATDAAGNTATATTVLHVLGMPGDKVVYLTFDDGPSVMTPKILEELRREGVKATFFVTAQWPECLHYLTQEARDGHSVAAHSKSHNFRIYSSRQAYWADLHQILDTIEHYTGQRTRMVRFPGGSTNTAYKKYNGEHMFMRSLRHELLDSGYQYADWHLDSWDSRGNNVPSEVIAQHSTDTTDDQVVVLMHDAGAKTTTPGALPAIIKWYRDHGYHFGVIKSPAFVCHHNNS